MNFSAWSIKNPIPVILLFFLLMIAGVISFRSSGVQDLPDIELPVVVVTTSLPGASPTQLENAVARKLENAVATLPDAKHVYSYIGSGTVTTSIEFQLEKDISDAMDEVRDAVTRVRADLPGDVKDPVFSRLNTGGRPILTYTVSSDHLDEEALSWYVDDAVSKALLSVRGVGKITRVGGVTREARVELDPARLAALQVSAATISRQLQRVQQESSAGKADIGGALQTIRASGTVASVAELAALELALPDGRRVRLDQVATVSDSVADRSALALLDGKPAVAFEVMRAKGASETAVAQAVRHVVANLNAQQTHVVVREAFDSVAPVAENYAGSMALLYEGAALTVLVMWLFLRDWRATLVCAAALPLSILPTFFAMYCVGFTLNTVTLLSLALVVGVLIDDAIVEIENIVRHLRMGKTAFNAALDAADEIGLAVVATTLTLIAVFLPTAFMSGIAGKFFKQFGWTAAVAVGASLLVARLVTPMMAAHLLQRLAKPHRDGWLMDRYLAAAAWCIKYRGRTVVAAGVFFVASLALIPALPTDFMPPADHGQTKVTLELAPGSTLADTRAAAERARLLISRDKDVTQVYTAIGAGFGGGDAFASGGLSEQREAALTVSLTHRTRRDRSQTEIEAALRSILADLPGARVSVAAGNGGQRLALVLSGNDPQALRVAAQRVQTDMRTIPGLGNVTSNAGLLRPEILVTLDFAKAADLGVNTLDIAETLRIATAGDYDPALAKLNLAERQIPVRASFPKAAREKLSVLEQIHVPGKNGNVMLGTVAHLRLVDAPVDIVRRDRSRNVIIGAELNGLQLGDVLQKVNALPSLRGLPPGIHREESGDAEMLQELFSGFGVAMFTGVLCIYIVLVLLFKDFLQPLTILAALPLSVGGALVALLVTGHAFSMPSLIGLLMLMGIAVKNSILLVEYAVAARRDHGLSRLDAVLDACRKRAQPIVMTTIAMGAGMLPIALGLGADASFRTPMAIAVIGGLVTSTFLSLLVIPAVFTYVDDVWHRKSIRLAPALRA